jgi:hypothetical protein
MMVAYIAEVEEQMWRNVLKYRSLSIGEGDGG